ncbi:MAG: ABC transporter substrate-binding protein [Cellulosilyticaceae bacterium]
MHMRKIFSTGMSVAALIAVLVGINVNTEALANTQTLANTNPAKARVDAEDTLAIGMNCSGIRYLLPIYSRSESEDFAIDMMYEALINVNEKGDYIPVIAENMPDLSTDQKTYTFKIKKGLKFSDGSPVTAKDVAYTFTTICSPDYDGQYYYNLMDKLEGAEAYKNNQTKTVSGIKVPDEYTITFTFKEALVNNLESLSDIGIMPEKHYFSKENPIKELKMRMKKNDIVGSGPYKLGQVIKGGAIQLVRNEHYTNGTPAKIQNVILKTITTEELAETLKNGSIDLAPDVEIQQENLEQLKAINFINTRKYLDNSYGFMVFNFDDKRLADKNVRKALTYGFDREKFGADYYGIDNQKTPQSPLLEGTWAYTDRLQQSLNAYHYDAKKAAELLEKSGWKKGTDGILEKQGQKLEFKLTAYTESKYEEALVKQLKEDWSKIGVKLETDYVEFNVLAENVFSKQEFEISNLSWAINPDPDSNFSTFHSSADVLDGNNAGSFRNEKNDQLLEQGRKEFDKSKLKEIYTDWALLINEELPYMFLTQSMRADYINARVKNIEPYNYLTLAANIKNLELQK